MIAFFNSVGTLSSVTLKIGLLDSDSKLFLTRDIHLGYSAKESSLMWVSL